MLYYLAEQYKQTIPLLSLVYCFSFRVVGSMLSAFILSLVLGRWFIVKGSPYLCSKSRQYTPKQARISNDPPSMGGLFVIGAVTLTTFIWCSLSDPFVWIMLISLVGFAAIGAWDDWCKIKYGKGISSRTKSLCQCSMALVLFFLCSKMVLFSAIVTIPFFHSIHLDLGRMFFVWFIFVVVGTSNAVNLTDGLDGLAVTSLIPTFLLFSIIAHLAGTLSLATSFAIPFAATNQVAIMGMALVGASLGFLWYNVYPAQVMMGDVGALSLGATLGLMALLVKQELLLVIAGGIFVLETVSVILQLLSYQLRGCRLFKMAPIHHHFELLGVSETAITVRFGIVSVMLCTIALLVLWC